MNPLFLCFLFALVFSLPHVKRAVINPPITSPGVGTVWNVGSQVTVTWDTSNIPEDDSQVTNLQGRVVLGFLENDSENLMLNSPLAEGFSLRDGHANVTVPSVPPRDNYIVVLFGDSGNISPEFTIQGGASSVSSSPGNTLAASASDLSTLTIPTLSEPIPITGSSVTGGSASSEVPTSAPTSSAPESTAASPSTSEVTITASSATPSSVSPSGTAASQTVSSAVSPSGTSAGDSTGDNAALKAHIGPCALGMVSLVFILNTIF